MLTQSQLRPVLVRLAQDAARQARPLIPLASPDSAMVCGCITRNPKPNELPYRLSYFQRNHDETVTALGHTEFASVDAALDCILQGAFVEGLFQLVPDELVRQ